MLVRLTVLVGALLLASCASVRAQEVAVTLEDGGWTADPVVFGEVGKVTFTLSNEGSVAHRPVAASTLRSVEELTAHIEDLGTENLIAELAGDEVPGIGAALMLGSGGHFHPGGPDEIDLPSDARVSIEDEGETIRYLFTSVVTPGGSVSGSIQAGKAFAGDSFDNVAAFAVVCLDHPGEYVVFGVEADG